MRGIVTRVTEPDGVPGSRQNAPISSLGGLTTSFHSGTDAPFRGVDVKVHRPETPDPGRCSRTTLHESDSHPHTPPTKMTMASEIQC